MHDNTASSFHDATIATLRAVKDGDWLEAKPLLREMADPTPYPVAALGPIFGPAAERIHEATRADLAICGQSVLSALFLPVQRYADVVIDGRRFPVSENFLTIAVSGDRKSAADKFALLKHHDYQQSQAEIFEQEKGEYNHELDEYMASKRKKSSTKAPEPTPPRSPLFIIDDPTYEGVVRHFEEGPPSCGIFTDEGGKLLGGYSLREQNKLRMGAALSNLWDGKPISSLRGMTGARLLYNRRLSSHILVQPGVAMDFLSDKQLTDQGLFGRMLITHPRPRPACEYSNIDLTEDAVMQKYYARINTLFLEEPKLHTEPFKGLDLRRIVLSASAKRLWIAFHDDTENWRVPGGRYGNISWLTAKAAEHAARIAAALALGENIRTENIEPDHVTRAVAIVEHHLAETHRIVDSSQDSEWLKLAQKLLAWLQTQPKTNGEIIVSTTTVYQKGPSKIRDASKARRMLETLEEHGWVRRVTTTGERWEIRAA